VDGGGDGALHRNLARFTHEILQPRQGIAGAVGVNGGDAAGMAGVPGLDQL
jgi:hypothetical protein